MTELERKQSTCVLGKKKKASQQNCDPLENTAIRMALKHLQRMREGHRDGGTWREKTALQMSGCPHCPALGLCLLADASSQAIECKSRLSQQQTETWCLPATALSPGSRCALLSRRKNSSPRLTFCYLLAALNKSW